VIKDYTVLGIDGGATKASGINLKIVNRKFIRGNHKVSLTYSDHPHFDHGFKPVNIDVQISEFKSGKLNILESELNQSTAIIESIAEIIIILYKKSGEKPLLIGIGMPGLKTSDNLGITVMANGPRMPELTHQLMDSLNKAAIDLTTPISFLGSDAFFCGVGEEYSRSGKFAEVENACYIGGGTGIADVVKLNGQLHSFETTQDWLLKTWRLKTADGIPLEKLLSAKGISNSYNQQRNDNIHAGELMERALNSDLTAVKILETSGVWLGRLFLERITMLYNCHSNEEYFRYPSGIELANTHSFIDSVFDRLVIGQRLGELINTNDKDNPLWHSLIAELEFLLQSSSALSNNIKSHYIDGLNSNLLQISLLRSAPALGAGIDAYQRFLAVSNNGEYS
jgi:predicted NBD/HSP70 family sugar kinase